METILCVTIKFNKKITLHRGGNLFSKNALPSSVNVAVVIVPIENKLKTPPIMLGWCARRSSAGSIEIVVTSFNRAHSRPDDSRAISAASHFFADVFIYVRNENERTMSAKRERTVPRRQWHKAIQYATKRFLMICLILFFFFAQIPLLCRKRMNAYTLNRLTDNAREKNQYQRLKQLYRYCLCVYIYIPVSVYKHTL